MQIRPRPRKTAPFMLAIALALAAPSTSTLAGGSDWMNDYFNSAGAAMNVSPAAIYESQGQSTLSLGGFSYRAPQRSANIFSFSPPGYKAGCGGIDAWLGAYGFINADAFVNMLRNIGQNAVGYFFQLALKTMAPEIDGLLTDLSKKMDALNKFNINACNTMKTAFPQQMSPAELKNMTLEQRAQVFGSTVTGGFSSFFDSKNKQETDPALTKKTYNDACTLSSVICMAFNEKTGKYDIPALQHDTNLVYEALNREGVYSTEEIEFYISLFGTAVLLTTGDDPKKGGYSVTYYPATLAWKDMLGGHDVDSLVVKIRKCPADSEGCLYSSTDSTPVDRTTTGMTAVVYERLQKIAKAINDRSQLDDAKAFQLMAMTSIPIYQLIAQSINSGRGSSAVTEQIMFSFSEAIATEIVYRQLLDIGREVTDSLNKMDSVASAGDKSQIDSIKRDMRATIAAADQAFNTSRKEVTDKMNSISMMLAFQRQMYTSMSPRLITNIEFGSRK